MLALQKCRFFELYLPLLSYFLSAMIKFDIIGYRAVFHVIEMLDTPSLPRTINWVFVVVILMKMSHFMVGNDANFICPTFLYTFVGHTEDGRKARSDQKGKG